MNPYSISLFAIALAAGGWTFHRKVRRHGWRNGRRLVGAITSSALVAVLVFYAAFLISMLLLAALFSLWE
ncbi:PEP-CTERM protein-sorting domain-containing protein [Saccharopolyspora antimicrobica]|uniref:PEP-CTERM protein-sorting domain-containing protein n=1 Tax=Saccharopolyspora antimicrobica TaxID=455193 RepID=A0A1I5JBB3_9PSEU|nr:hypothetical protein [Saccharopolyspora antimicrobica]RKT82442.1 putative secreted protein with PEP-CTERM sorting signal [Saccharopolyspora antimicrobica]SFO69863.1 PEP-CTERM protein-sorting domain-containing protein [Saccharopolyspora antimicrobica]